MAILKCKMCGGDMELTADKTYGMCEYCGSTMTLPRIDDDQRATAFNRGNHFRRIGEFDKALTIYERIVREDDTDAEAHWCCALCRFGIEYVEDPATFEYIPTCHRASFDSFLEDVDYLAALEHSEGITRRQYQKEGAKIAEVQKGILATSQNAEDFDVFICYKETDDQGERTRDSLMAQDIYYQLTEQGHRVFFARITLEDVAGAQYEPYIFAALHSAKVMVVVGTKPEHLNAVWVKNEWSRFLAMMKKEHSKLLLPCYRDMDPYDMPDQLAVLQSYDMAKIGFIQDLTRGIKKVLETEKKPDMVQEPVMVQQAAATPVAPLLQRVFMFLEDGEWASADEYCEKVLDLEPQNARAYLGKLMAELRLRKEEQLGQQKEPFDNKNSYNKAIRFGDDALRSTLEGYVAKVKEEKKKQEQKELEERLAREKREEEERLAREKQEEEERLAREKREEEERLAREKREAQERLALEKVKQELRKKMQESAQYAKLIAAGNYCTIGITENGKVQLSGEQICSRISVADWYDVVAVDAGTNHLVGLTEQGTVVAVGSNDYRRCEVEYFQNVVDVKAGAMHTVCLLENGKVKAVGWNVFGQCDVDEWEDIVSIAANGGYTLGLRSDGTMEVAGHNKHGQCNVYTWSDIMAICAGFEHAVGLRTNGTVVATGQNEYGQCRVGSWENIIAISAGVEHTVGLRDDGTVVATGCNGYGQCNVSGWRDIVAVCAGGYHTVGLKKDGTVLVAGKGGEDRVEEWKLFDTLESMAMQRKTAVDRCRAGLCRYCGGELKGFLLKKCVQCGAQKDY